MATPLQDDPGPVAGLRAVRAWAHPRVLAVLPPLNGPVLTTDLHHALDLLATGVQVSWAPANPASLALGELAVAALRALPVQSVRSLLGLAHFGRRVWFYHYLRDALPTTSRQFWDAAEGHIRQGLMDQGAAEVALGRFRTRVLSALVAPHAVAELMAAAPAERTAVVAERWSGRRWRAFLLSLRTPVAQRALGLHHPDPIALAARLRAALAAPDAVHPLHYVLEGGPGPESELPAWLRAEGHAAAKARLGELQIVEGGWARAAASPPSGGWAAAVLGQDAAPNALSPSLRAGGWIAWWRAAPASAPAGFRVDAEAGRHASASEPCPFWSGVDVLRKA